MIHRIESNPAHIIQNEFLLKGRYLGEQCPLTIQANCILSECKVCCISSSVVGFWLTSDLLSAVQLDFSGSDTWDGFLAGGGCGADGFTSSLSTLDILGVSTLLFL